MKHRIVVLGAGYAGANAAGRLARRLHLDDTEIIVVNADPDFVERVRSHQLAVGQELQRRRLIDVYAGTGVQVRIARVTAVDADRKTVALIDDQGVNEIAYDTRLRPRQHLGRQWRPRRRRACVRRRGQAVRAAAA